jgi:putative membrane protein
MEKVKQFLWVYLLAISALAAGCTEKVEPVRIRSDQDFVNYVAYTGLFKIQASRLAIQVAGSNDLKLLSKEIFDYYTAANDDLARVSIENGFSVPVSLDEERQQLYNRLDRLWGQDFDKQYLTDMQKIYQEDIKWYEEAAAKLKNSELKAWAGISLQEIRMQQTGLQQVASRLGS